MSLTWAAVDLQHSHSSGYLWWNQNAKAVVVVRGVWGMELLIKSEWAEKAQHLLLSVMNTLLWVLAQMRPWAMPTGSPQGPWGSGWKRPWLSSVSGHCKRLLLWRREFKELIAMSLSWLSAVPWTYRGYLCFPFGVGRSWKEATVSLLWGGRCSVWRWWLLCQSNEAALSSANSICLKVRKLWMRKSNPGGKAWCMHLPSRGGGVTWG